MKLIGSLIRNHSVLYRTKASLPVCTLTRSKYYMLVPEIPSDTVETNPFMRNDDVIDYVNIAPRQVQKGFQKLLVNYDEETNQLFESFDKNLLNKTFDDIFLPLEQSLATLDYGFKKARHFAFSFPYSPYHIAYSRIQNKIYTSINAKWMNGNFFKALKHLDSNKHLLNDVQKRILEISLKNCVYNGLNLNEANLGVCNEINSKIDEQQFFFRNRLDYANRVFGLRISDQMNIDDIPIRIKKLISTDRKNPNKGPWTVIPDDQVFEGFMKYCGDRNLRKSLYEAYYSRASYVNEQYQTNNSEVIKDLVRYRKELAKLHGFKNFADFRLEKSSAVKVENVIDLFEKIKTNIKPVADQDLQKLQKYSANHGNKGAPLENYDIEYWKTRHTTQYFGADNAKIKQYYPFKKVLSGLFELSKKMFNAEFRIDESQNDKLWNPKVQLYKVYNENNEHISYLFVDPYVRTRKIDSIWCYSGRESSTTVDAKPIAYFNLNIAEEGDSTTLSFEQMKKIFYEFGNALQILLTKTPFTDLSDVNSTEMDAFNINSQLFERLLYIPQVNNLVSAHVNTGEPLPVDMLNQLKNGNSNFKSFNLCKKTFLAAFDIECHISNDFWADIYSQLWPKFMSAKATENDYRPCQFSSIFGHNYGGCSYYSLLWSEMLTADLFEAFKDVGFDNKAKLLDVGMKYRDTIIKPGSTVHINEKFRQFRGRNPSMDPFIKSYLPKPKAN